MNNSPPRTGNLKNSVIECIDFCKNKMGEYTNYRTHMYVYTNTSLKIHLWLIKRLRTSVMKKQKFEVLKDISSDYNKCYKIYMIKKGALNLKVLLHTITPKHFLSNTTYESRYKIRRLKTEKR